MTVFCSGSFGWSVAEACVKEGFWPDLISTDLHTQSMEGPAYDLPTVMTKMLHLGMPLGEVIAAVTSKPAAAIGKSKEIGSLKVCITILTEQSMMKLYLLPVLLIDFSHSFWTPDWLMFSQCAHHLFVLLFYLWLSYCIFSLPHFLFLIYTLEESNPHFSDGSVYYYCTCT